MIRVVVFDLGRVVLWFDNDIFLRKLAARTGKSLESIKRDVHARLELIRQFDAGTLSPREFYENVCRVAGTEVPMDFFYTIYNDIFELNEPVLDIVRKLRKKDYILVLLSNTDPERYGFIRKRFPEIFLFDHYILSYEERLLKPDPAIYVEAVRRAGVEPDECVFIDDREENVSGARLAGLRGIHYLPDKDLETELMRLGVSL